MKLKSLIFPDWLKRLLTTPTEELSRWQYAARYFVELCRHGATRLKQDRANQMAAALAFRTIFGLVPVVIIAMLLFRALDDKDIFNQFIENMLAAAHLNDIAGPDESMTLGQWVQDRVAVIGSQLNTKTIGLIGALVLGWAAIGLLTTIERCFNTVCQAQENRPLLRRIPLYWMTVTLGPILLWMSFDFQNRFVRIVQNTGFAEGFASIVGTITSFVAAWMMLLVLYELLPNTRVRLTSALGGAFVAAVLWTMVTSAFGAYVKWSFNNESSAFTILYGTLGLIPLFLLWIYVLWLIVIYGLEITNMLQVVRGRMDQPMPVKVELPALTDPAGIIPIMECIGNRFAQGMSTSTDRIVEETGLNPRGVDAMIDGLCQAAIIHRVGESEEDQFAPALPVEQITTDKLLEVSLGLTRSSHPEDQRGWNWVENYHKALAKLPIHKRLNEI